MSQGWSRLLAPPALIRPARGDEIGRLGELWAQGLPNVGGPLGRSPRARTGFDQEQTGRLHDRLRDRQPLFVAVSEERVVGFAAVEPCRSHHQFAAEILVLYVEPERRRAGIGWALFDAVQFAMLERGADSILAWIPADAPARHALVRMGGQEVERRVVRALGPPTRQVIHIAYGWRG